MTTATVTLAGKALNIISASWSMGLDEENPTTASININSSELDFVTSNKGQDLVITIDKYTFTFILTGISLEYNGSWTLVMEGSGGRWVMDRIFKNVIRSDVTFKQLASSLAEEHNVTINSDIKIEARYKTIIQSGQTDYFHLKQEADRHGLDIVDKGKTLDLKTKPSPIKPTGYSILLDHCTSFSYQDLAQTKDSGIGAEPVRSSSAAVKRASLNPRTGQINQPNRKLNLPAGKPDIVTLGRSLQAAGYRVSEHPAFGGVGNSHRGRGHYEGRAIDVNVSFGNPPEEKGRLDQLRAQLGANSGYLIRWRTGGHFDHMHIEVPTDRRLANVGVNRISPNITQPDIDSLIDKTKHKEFKGLQATVRLDNDFMSLGVSPSDAITTKSSVIKSLNRVWLVAGIAFEYSGLLTSTITLQAPQFDLNAYEGDT